MPAFFDFLEWYLLRAPKSQLIFAKNTAAMIEDNFGILINLRYFFAPYYHDTSYTGRALSLVVRTITIITGLIAILFFSLILFSLPIAWLVLPFLFFYSPLTLISILFGAIYYTTITRHKPKNLNPFITKPYDIRDSMGLSARTLYNMYPSPLFWQDLASNSKAARFLIKSGIPYHESFQILSRSPIQEKNLLLSTIHELATQYKLRKIRVVHLLMAIISEQFDLLQALLQKYLLDKRTLQTYLEWDEYEYNRAHPPQPFDPDYTLSQGGGTNRDHRGVITPLLDSQSIDYTKEAFGRRHELRIIRTQIIDQIQTVLEKNSNANVILKGEDGVGKESLIWEISQLILSGKLTGKLWEKRIVGLNIASLLSANPNNSHESLLSSILQEIQRSADIIIYINDIIPAIESQRTHGISIFALLQEPLSQQRCNIILSCSPEEYSRLKNEYPTLIGLSETIDIQETTIEETLHICHLASLKFEENYNVLIPYSIIQQAVSLADEYIFQKPFPEKALNLLEDTVIEASHLDTYTQTPWGAKIILQPRMLSQTLTQKTHIPTGIVNQSEADKLLNLETSLQSDIVGQKEAIRAISTTLQRNRTGLRAANKPIGSFLFAGPTGVGKTHIAKMLAKHYYGSEDAMIRLDMSEFQTAQALQRLTSREAGSLIEQVRQKPFSLVLLDELEKADKHIIDAFLQVLDDARLTDQYGNVCKFNQTIIIATTNVGNTQISQLPQDHEFFNSAVQILQHEFRTEFLNRFDNIIAFHPLTSDDIRAVIQLQTSKLHDKLYQDRKIDLQLSPTTIEWLLTFGYSSELGARNLNRVLQDTVETKLAQMILKGEVQNGQSITL